MGISVVIIAKNEEKNIGECLASVAFADERIVIDDCSTDKTVEIAKALGAKVFQHPMNNNFGEQKTFGIKQAGNNWVLLLDCDERVTDELAEELISYNKISNQVAYEIPRLNHFIGRLLLHGGWYPDKSIRFFPRTGVSVQGKVHESIVHTYPVQSTKAALVHYTYNSWDQYLAKQNRYSTLGAEKNFDTGKRAVPVLDFVLRPAFAFFKKLVIQRGFLDGWTGFVLAANYANYTLSKYVKLYDLQRRQER